MTGGRDRKAGWDRRGAGGTNGRLTRPTLNYWPSRSAMSTRTLSKGMCFRASTLPTAQVVSRPPEDAIPTRTQIRCSDVAPEMAIRNFPAESTRPLPPTEELRVVQKKKSCPGDTSSGKLEMPGDRLFHRGIPWTLPERSSVLRMGR